MTRLTLQLDTFLGYRVVAHRIAVSLYLKIVLGFVINRCASESYRCAPYQPSVAVNSQHRQQGEECTRLG